MDSPIRTTRQEDKHNIREEFRGGMIREVWDELDENGNIVKTAVWDVLDRAGLPLGEQSWDEYEKYIDDLREATRQAKKPGRKSKISAAEKARIKAEKDAEKEAKARKNKDDITAIFEYFLEENPEPFDQIPSYRLYEKIVPYAEKLNIEDMPFKRYSSILAMHKDYLQAMGFTFSKGWSFLSRTTCVYIGYKSNVMVEEQRKKASRDDTIGDIVRKIPAGEYKRTDMARLVATKMPEVNSSNLSWVLARNARKFELVYDYAKDTLTKEE